MPRKPVVPANVAAALTDAKPRAARVVNALAHPDAAPDAPDAAQAAPVPSGADLPAPLVPAPVPIAPPEVIAEKDVETLTREILALENQGACVILEIGKRLIAAKAKLEHGEWLPWLERVNIPLRLAQRYMQLARDWTNATTLTYLGMSKALALLALPEPERDDFIEQPHMVNGEEKSVDEMSVRQLQEAIEARKLAEAQLYEAERRLRESDADNDKVRRELTLAQNRLAIAEEDKAKAVAERDAEQQKRFAVADELEALKKKPIEVAVEKVPDPEAIRKAKQEERESMQFLIDKANTERDAANINAGKLKADIDSVKRDLSAEQKRADDAQHDLEVAQSDLAETRKELERVRAEAEQRAKASPIANTDLQRFAVLSEQTQEAANQMISILKSQPEEKQASLRKFLLQLADAIRKAAES